MANYITNFFPITVIVLKILSMRSQKFGWGVGDLKSIFWGESGVKVKKPAPKGWSNKI